MTDPSTKPSDELLRFLDGFIVESDRAAVVVGCAMLDELLEQVLKRAFLPCSTTEDDLLGSEKPLGSFSARIHLAHRLGLIDSAFSRQLHLIKKLRNDFAHKLSASTLDASPHRDRIREIVEPFAKRIDYDALSANTKSQYGVSLSKTSLGFRVAIAITAARLEFLNESCGSRAADNPCALVPATWRG